jgi:large subunit ribosomal protein L15
VEYQVVNLDQLDRLEGIEEVTPEALRAVGLARRTGKPVKVLARGAVSKPLVVRAHAFSAGAREAITAAGGTAVVIE